MSLTCNHNGKPLPPENGQAPGPGRRKGPRTPGIARAVEFIEERYMDPIQVLDMAKHAQMSPFHFIRRFRSELDITPHRYLMKVRMEHAQQLLVQRTDLRIKEVGRMVGYEDPTAFTRVFHNWFHATPQDHREREICRRLEEWKNGARPDHRPLPARLNGPAPPNAPSSY